VKKTFSLDERSAKMLEQYAHDLHISQSALLSMFITQLDQGIRTTVNVIGTEEDKALLAERYGTGRSGDD
jgi:hypothetical protein